MDHSIAVTEFIPARKLAQATRPPHNLTIVACVLGSMMMLGVYFVKPSTFSSIKFPLALTSPSPPSSSPSIDSSEALLQRLSQNGTKECHNVSTTASVLFGLPTPAEGGEVTLLTDVLHKFWMVSYAADGSRRCFGGDFFETDLSGPNWKSRPSVIDMGNGSYLVELKVDKEFAGTYSFRAILLFPNFHGMDPSPQDWALKKEMFHLKIRFVSSKKRNETRTLPTCTSKDFRSSTTFTWSGKWTRTKSNDSCTFDNEGRYRCLEENEQCDQSQCSGSIASLESNGWVYSTHCKFRIWNSIDAWKCLDGKKLFFWGDSNHQDTIRNLMNFVLGFHHEDYLPRVFIANLTNPSNPAQNFTVVEIFNGHTNPDLNNLGLKTLQDSRYREYLTREFLRDGPAHALILNSGLHDGNAFGSTSEYANASIEAARFWKTLATAAGTRVIFRSTVAPAGASRSMPSNPQKMEAFNAILGGEIRREMGESAVVVDDYDMTFPWHYDQDYSDGGHYGRPASLSPWFGRIGHYYFVDLMLVHALLTAICS